jgi:hypothetical protein
MRRDEVVEQSMTKLVPKPSSYRLAQEYRDTKHSRGESGSSRIPRGDGHQYPGFPPAQRRVDAPDRHGIRIESSEYRMALHTLLQAGVQFPLRPAQQGHVVTA